MLRVDISGRGIAYWVFAGSVIGYSCNSFANTILLPSVLTAYQCLQPLVGIIFACK